MKKEEFGVVKWLIVNHRNVNSLLLLFYSSAEFSFSLCNNIYQFVQSKNNERSTFKIY